MSSSRKAARAALANLLKTALTKVDGDAVFGYQVGNFAGMSPVVYVTSSGSLRRRMTAQGSRASFRLNIHTFVLYADPGSGWTEQMAEDVLDDLEQEIAQVLDANQQTADWAALEWEDMSNADVPVTIGGSQYLHEVIGVRVEVMG